MIPLTFTEEEIFEITFALGLAIGYASRVGEPTEELLRTGSLWLSRLEEARRDR
jgi:hypothetical protein